MPAVTFDYEMTHSSSDVLYSVPFHVFIWILLSMGIVGNFLVILWRLSQKRDNRSSILSLLIIILAVADLIYSLHLLLLEGLVAKAFFGSRPANILPESSTATVCGASGSLSIISCSLALWITFDIAIYSVQSIAGRNCCCCCLLDTKGKLCLTIFCQCLFTTIPILIFSISYPLTMNDLFHSPYYKSWEELYDTDVQNTTIRSIGIQIGDILATCAFVQSTGIHFFTNYSLADQSTHGCNGKAASAFQILGGCLLSINTFLVVACAVLYLQVCQKLHSIIRQTTGRSGRLSEHPQWRLSIIVLVNTLCWLPATILHWMSYVENLVGDGSCHFSTVSTAANMLLISVSPAVNPLIYTLTVRNFFQSIRNCFKKVKCHVSLRQKADGSKLENSPSIGVDQCTCFPCIKCVKRWEDFDTDSWCTEETTTLLS